MSLLLDALKRSEKARQEKAALEAGEGPAETREFSLETLEEEAKDPRNQPEARLPREDRPRVAETVERSAVMPADDMDAPRRSATEDTVEGFPDMEIVEPAPADTADRGIGVSADVERDAVGETGERPTFSLLDEEPVDERAVADTGGTIPSAESVRSSMDRYFDGTQSVPVSMREVRRAIGDEESAADGGGETSGEHLASGRTSTTQRRARTVVEARTAASRARGRSSAWAWSVLLLLFGGLLAGGGYYYYTTVLSGGSSLLAGLPPQPRSQPAPPPPPAPAAVVPSETTPVTTAALTALPEPAPAALPEPPVRGELAATAEAVAAQPPPAVELPPPPPVEELVKTPEPEPAAEPVDPQDLSTRLAAAIEQAGLQPRSNGIRISRVARKDRVSPLLTQAFEAFQRGDLAAARSAWQEVLAHNPGNRDALLGLAAAAVRSNQPQQAVELYLRVLRARPQDRLAQASLIALSERLDPVEAESRIKRLLDGAPRAPYLHFILGNLYAAQSRWALAQEAYFNAYRLDSSNADYAFNLAVSLDHLAQAPAALSYYQRALQLSDNRPAGFEPAAVMNRIRVMTADATGQ